ncbi:MAG: peptidoglycan D,D-transpeptidase FtsI family protein [Gammaproteobacteria bacterium]
MRIHKTAKNDAGFALRRKFLFVSMLCGMALLAGRAVDLQILNKGFLQHQGNIRHVGEVEVSAYRGKILDRNGEPLAISTPVESIFINPQETGEVDDASLRQLADLLDWRMARLREAFDPAGGRSFVYLKRRINPELASRVRKLQIAGLHFQREFKRYYPAGEMTGHLLGFTDVDDNGQEGIELAYDNILQGVPGKKRVIRDGGKNIIADIENIKAPVPGQDLVLSIDNRLQYLAYRELKAAVIEHKAQSGSLVMLDAKNGDILAVVNQPSFNPNTRESLKGMRYRNRAFTDSFEPGSTVKPFVVASALDSGAVGLNYSVDTSPGSYALGRHRVRDIHNYGLLNLTQILKKSSNVAVSKIALKMTPQTFWGFYDRLGFGVSAGIGFPGEADGLLMDHRNMSPFEQATLSFGYGVSASVLQLARAYTALADDGLLHSASLFKRDRDVDAQRVFSPATARIVREMLEEVVKKDGTAYRARVEGYRVAGKTGTVKKAGLGGYSGKKYQSVFVGMAPAGDPRLVMAIMIDEPGAGDYYGGLVSGPVFSKVMAGALRVLGIAPDQEDHIPVLLVRQGERA